MSDERTRPGSGSENGERVDVPVARAQASAGAPTYSEKQVAQILQRAAQLERGRAQHKPELSLAEIEEIAREAGLDPSLIKVAAQSLESTQRERSLGSRIAGAPLRRVFERVIDGELTQALHERINGDLRAAMRGQHRNQGPQISSVGRTLTMSAHVNSGELELELTPRGNKMLLRIEVSCSQIAGGLFGGLGGGLGGGMTGAIIGLSAHAHFGPPAVAATFVLWWASVYGLARGIFTWRANALYARTEKLADQLAERIRDELAQPKA